MQLPNYKDAKLRNKNDVVREEYLFNNNLSTIGKGKTYHVKTYGCQMNEHDSENIKAMLEYMGYKNTDTLEKSDIVILNTCSIRENANNKVFGFLGRVKHLKNFKKDLIVGITGCMTQEEVIANKLLEKYKWVNFVVGTHMLDKINEEVYNAINGSKLDIIAPSIEGNIIEDLPVRRESKYKAYINIQLGCDKFCTYCIVPYTRGKQRSRHKEDILNEVIKLKEEGYKEITLLGQNVNAYGKDLYDNYTMANLLEDVALTGMERIRFITSHPWDFTDEMIEVIKKYPNVLNHVHLPVQSGNSDILKLMGRRYTKEEYLTLYNKLKNGIPNISITTDIIVGFPGETNEQFEDTLDLVEKCKFDLAYTFIFSKRVGTPAYNMKDETSMEEKEERLQILNELINKYALINNKKLINKEENVLVEGFSSKNSDLLMGYTETNKLVNFKGDPSLIGKIVKVKILDAKTWSLDGEYVK
mgnify:FL=1